MVPPLKVTELFRIGHSTANVCLWSSHVSNRCGIAECEIAEYTKLNWCPHTFGTKLNSYLHNSYCPDLCWDLYGDLLSTKS